MSETYLLSALVPARDALLIALRNRLTSAQIHCMARSDVDIPSEVKSNLDALEEIIRTGVVQGCLPWNPAEICNLHRWEPVSSNKSNSAMVVFACWILINAYTQRESMKSGLIDDGDQYAIVALVEHALNLDNALAKETAEFLYWAYLELLEASDHRSVARPFYLFGLFGLFAIWGAVPDLFADEDIRTIADRLCAEERRVSELFVEKPHLFESNVPSHWLLGIAGTDINGFNARCKRLVSRAKNVSQTSKSSIPLQMVEDILSDWKHI